MSTTYDALGRVEEVTQFDNATVGSGSEVNGYKHTYDGWGNREKYEQDHNSAVGASGSVDDYDVTRAYAKATSGGNTIRPTSITYPDGFVVTYTYSTLSSLHDDEANRVTFVKNGGTTLATYLYNGVKHAVSIDLPEPDIYRNQAANDYADFDRFTRVASDRWTKDLVTDIDFYSYDITYDRFDSVTLAENNIHSGFDVEYTMNDLAQVTKSEEGTWNGSSITSRTRQQVLTLDQLGNFDVAKLDLNGDNDFTDTGESDDDRTHGDANELTGRDTDDNGTDDYTLTFDGLGNPTDDGENYKYEYDVFSRLRKVRDRSDDSLVAEFEYNANGHMTVVHYDVDADGDVDSNDPKYEFAYTDNWQLVEVYHEDDTASDAKERFVYHAHPYAHADAIIFRDKDADTAWSDASDETLEERIYYCQNWRGDTCALVRDDGSLVESVAYSNQAAYFGIPAGDTDGDGDLDSTDVSTIENWARNGPQDQRGDLDLDGDVDFADLTAASNASPITLGYLKLSSVGNRMGHNGFMRDFAIEDLAHVRRRAFRIDLGRWIQRDPSGYSDGNNLYQYVRGRSASTTDPSGLITFTLGPAPAALNWYTKCGQWQHAATETLTWGAADPATVQVVGDVLYVMYCECKPNCQGGGFSNRIYEDWGQRARPAGGALTLGNHYFGNDEQFPDTWGRQYGRAFGKVFPVTGVNNYIIPGEGFQQEGTEEGVLPNGDPYWLTLAGDCCGNPESGLTNNFSLTMPSYWANGSAIAMSNTQYAGCAWNCCKGCNLNFGDPAQPICGNMSAYGIPAPPPKCQRKPGPGPLG